MREKERQHSDQQFLFSTIFLSCSEQRPSLGRNSLSSPRSERTSISSALAIDSAMPGGAFKVRTRTQVYFKLLAFVDSSEAIFDLRFDLATSRPFPSFSEKSVASDSQTVSSRGRRCSRRPASRARNSGSQGFLAEFIGIHWQMKFHLHTLAESACRPRGDHEAVSVSFSSSSEPSRKRQRSLRVVYPYLLACSFVCEFAPFVSSLRSPVRPPPLLFRASKAGPVMTLTIKFDSGCQQL